MPINQLNNGDSGLTARTIINELVDATNSGSIDTGSFATTGSNNFTGSQVITGSLNISGSNIITGSLNVSGSSIISGSLNVSGSVIVNGSSLDKPYKVYSALLTQTSTNAPTAIVLENTLGVIPTFTYYPGGGFDPQVGVYSIDAANTFTSSKTAVYCANPSNGLILLDPNSSAPNNIYMYSYNIVGPTLADGRLNKTFIEIRVYN